MRHVSLVMPLALLLVSTSPDPVWAEAPPAIVAEAEVKPPPADATSFRLGGYSGLAALDQSGTRFATVTDRGPNLAAGKGKDKILLFPLPTYSPAIVKVELHGERLTETARLPLRLADGQRDPRTGSALVTGLPNSATADPPAYDQSGQRRLEVDPYGLDTEGLAIDPRDGSYWICDEYGPSILNVDQDGVILTRLLPRGSDLQAPGQHLRAILPAELARRKPNHGLEGIALSPDGDRLFAIMEAPLSNPDKDSGERSRNIRLLTLDLSGPEPAVDGMYLYLAEPFGRVGAPSQDSVKVGDLAALSRSRLLAAERDSLPDGSFKMVYQVDLDQATNLLGRDDFKGRTLEQLSEDELNQLNIRPLAKSALVDIAALGWRSEKFEGLAIVDDQTIAVVDDNDFGLAGLDNGRPVANHVPTHLAVVQLPIALVR